MGFLDFFESDEEKLKRTTRELERQTKKMAEDLTDYLAQLGVRVRYLHSDISYFEYAH